MSRIVRKIESLPFWAWPAIGAGTGATIGAVITAGQLVIGVLAR